MTPTTVPQAGGPAPQVSTWNLDPVHSVAEFKVKHMMISNMKGHFSGVSGVLTLDENDLLRSRVEATIDAKSVHTRDAKRDAHLQGTDFFDVGKFPTMTFTSSNVQRTGDGELAV